jgi:ABC-2 type transport system permease protein
MTSSNLTTIGNPRSVITRFIARRTLPEAIFWGMLFGLTVLSSALGFIVAFPTAQDKAKVALTFGSNIGLKAILGIPHALNTVAGFTEWRALGVVTLFGAIWGLMLSTKLLRGDEEDGRWELLLSGKTSQRRGVVQALCGMGIALGILFLITFILTIITGKVHDVSLPAIGKLWLSLALITSPAVFMAVGSLTSQLAPTRRQAAVLAAGVFGLSFFLRVLADSTTNHAWISRISPLSWIGKLQPLTDPQPLWFIPIVAFIAIVAGLAIFLAGRRDLGDSVIKERAISKPNFSFLGSTWGLSFRLMRTGSLGWITAISFAALAFGSIAKSAALAFEDSPNIQGAISHIFSVSDNAALFLGLIFMILMIIVMVMAAGILSGIREEESSGHLDNLLVRPISRSSWLISRVLVGALSILAAGYAAGIGAWLSTHNQGLNLSLHQMIYAGINTSIPAIFLLGIGVFIFGIAPRLTSLCSYGLILLSFLIQFLASALNVHEWVLKLSVLHHMALAPAVDPNWHTNGILSLISLTATTLGIYFFSIRDIATE